MLLSIYGEEEGAIRVEIAHVAYRGRQLHAHAAARGLPVQPGTHPPALVGRIVPGAIETLRYAYAAPVEPFKVIVGGLLPRLFQRPEPRLFVEALFHSSISRIHNNSRSFTPGIVINP